MHSSIICQQQWLNTVRIKLYYIVHIRFEESAIVACMAHYIAQQNLWRLDFT